MFVIKGAVILLLLCFSTCRRSPAEDNWENLFLSIPSSARAYEHLAYYTSLPHTAGTPEDYQTALYTKRQLESFGLQPRIDAENVLLNYPLKRVVEITSPPELKFQASLQEDYIPEDPTSSDPRAIPTFHGYCPSANVSAQLVYVNYGRIEDYAVLDNLGISVKGKIVIVKYGEIFRGVKVMIAEQRGAVGVLIYSDPGDDGVTQGPVVPNGPYRPRSGVQRGSVQYLSLCAGDPSRPACRGNGGKQQRFYPSIPSQPLSWGDALPLLQAITVTKAPASWAGGLNITYNIGPSTATVHIETVMNFTKTDIWNVVAEIPGTNPNEVVLIGNHRDAWVFGAVDPNSGTAALLEVARAFGILLQNGWKPSRTIILCSWDGEEYGLLGSTAFAERYASRLSQAATAYINVDVGVSGPAFHASATPSLKSAIIEATKSIMDPNTGQSIYEIWNKNVPVLGSGSDFTAFLDNLGIPSMDMSFSGPYGVYHSVYDSQYWMNQFGDKTYKYHQAMAQLWGLVCLRIANPEILPYNFTDYANDLQTFFNQTVQLRDEYGGSSILNLNSLLGSINQFSAAAHKVNSVISLLKYKLFTEKDQKKPLQVIKALNSRLLMTERYFLGPGLPERPWYKHTIQAPGLYLGYGADRFPGVSQSIRDQDWKQAISQTAVLSQTISAAAKNLESDLPVVHFSPLEFN